MTNDQQKIIRPDQQRPLDLRRFLNDGERRVITETTKIMQQVLTPAQAASFLPLVAQNVHIAMRGIAIERKQKHAMAEELKVLRAIRWRYKLCYCGTKLTHAADRDWTCGDCGRQYDQEGLPMAHSPKIEGSTDGC